MILGYLLPGTGGHFANRLFLSITASEGTKNVIIAPLAIQEALALVFLACEGESNRELKKNIELKGYSKSEAMEEFKTAPLRITTTDVSLQTAYKFYVDNMFPLRGGFLRDAMTYLNSKPESVKFSMGPELSQQIGLYLGSLVQRRGVPKVIPVNDINTTTRSVLIQGFFFEGNFSRPFKQLIKRRLFYVQPHLAVPAVTFRKHDFVPYAELSQLNSQGVMIPYKNSNLSMMVLLPRKTSSLKRLETQLANTDIHTISKYFHNTLVQMEIPQFEFDYELDLIPALRRMGINAIFDYPEFNTLTDTPFFSLTKIKHSGGVSFQCGEDVCQKMNSNTKGISSLYNHSNSYTLLTDFQLLRSERCNQIYCQSPIYLYDQRPGEDLHNRQSYKATINLV